MSEKTIAGVTDDVKALQIEMQSLNQEHTATINKIEQLKVDLRQLRSQRDAMEKIQNDAPGLLISGGMTDAEFSNNKRSLAEFYAAIDDKESLLEIYEKGLDTSHTRRFSEISGKLERRKKLLIDLFSKELAAEIVGKQTEKLKQLAACLEHAQANPLGYNPSHLLGISLATVLFGDSAGNPKPQSAEERSRLVSDVFNKLGV